MLTLKDTFDHRSGRPEVVSFMSGLSSVSRWKIWLGISDNIVSVARPVSRPRLP